MKKFSEQLHKKSLSVKLQAAERRALRERVVSYMEYHPLPGATTKATAKAVAKPSPYFTDSFKVIPFSYLYRAGAAVAVFMMVLVPILAEQTVPGDGLYAIKVQFNEEIRSTLSFTAFQKIEWETERLNRRIAEARLLASEGRLTEEVGNDVATAVKMHTENAKREIEQLRSNDSEAAALATIELHTTLEVQAASLAEDESDEEEVSDSQVSSRVLATAIKEVSATESAINPGLPSYEKLVARIELNTTRVYELLTALDLDQSSPEYLDITRRISDIDATVQEAITQAETDDEAARTKLVAALQRTQRLIVFMSEIRASNEFVIEDFVPVVLNAEERQTRMFEYQKESQVSIARIEETLTSVADSDMRFKATETIAALKVLDARIASSTDFAEATTLYTEIKSLTTDVQKMLAQQESVRATTTLETTGVTEEVIEGTESGESE